jgi:hypothetical protein
VIAAAPPALRRIAADAWRFRLDVERDAEARFARLAERLSSAGAAPPVVALARRASRDEARHAAFCAELAGAYGAAIGPLAPAAPREIAPRDLGIRQRVLYEVVAACCIAETESLSVLTTLLDHVQGGRLRRVLRELAADEVGHGRLGWAHLASEHARGETAFLGPFVPAMLEGNAAPDLFLVAPADRENAALLEHGVVPHALKREVFVRTLEDVVFPGLAAFGVDPAPARAWLARRSARVPEGS